MNKKYKSAPIINTDYKKMPNYLGKARKYTTITDLKEEISILNDRINNATEILNKKIDISTDHLSNKINSKANCILSALGIATIFTWLVIIIAVKSI